MADIIDKNPQNNMPDILENPDFEPGDILTAGTMNQVVAAIRGTYQMLTQPPKLTYIDDEEFGEGKVKEWAQGDEMKLFFNFSSSVYGPATYTVKQYEGGKLIQTFSGQHTQGLITVNLGKANGQHKYGYEVTATDSNGREAMEGSSVKKLFFNQFIGGFTFNTKFNEQIKDSYFVLNKSTQISDIPYTLDYIGQEDATQIKKVIVAYFSDQPDNLLLTQEVTLTSGVYNLSLTPTEAGQKTLIIEGRVCKIKDGTIVKRQAFEYPLYVSDIAEAVIMTLERTPITDDLTSDSRLAIQYRVSWFQPWNNLTIKAVGKVLDKDGNEIKDKTARYLVTKNNSIVEYKIVTFPYNDIATDYTIQMHLELEGADSTSAIVTNPTNIPITVAPSANGSGFEETNLLAHFSATGRTNASDNKEQWIASHGEFAGQWFFDLQSCSYIDPEEEQTWDDVGAGWKEELDDNQEYVASYLHLKHNAYARLRTLQDPTKNIDLSSYFKNSNFTLETCIKTNEAANMLGYNLACVTENNKNGFCIRPTVIATLTNNTVDEIMAQQNNASTVLDNTWTHVAFVATPNQPTPSANSNDVRALEDQLPKLASMQLYINGVLVKMAPNVPSDEVCYLYLNNLVDKLNSDKESDTKIQFIRLYKAALQASTIRQNYINSLSDADLAEAIRLRNNTGSCKIPQVTLVAHADSENGFDVAGANGKGFAINGFTRSWKKYDPEQGHPIGFPGAGKVYVNCEMYFDDPINNLSDTRKHVKVAVQGTSSLDYPVKNYKIVVYDDAGKEKNKTYRPPNKQNATDGWHGDSTYTLKCDYMEHSHKNNTPTAMFYNRKLLAALLAAEDGTEIADFQSPARKAGYNDAIDGFPIILYCRDIQQDTTKYMGTYMFNTDKAGLDQGFALPTEETKFTIPYYEEGYTCEQQWDATAGVNKTVFIGQGDRKTVSITDNAIPCISYEGGSNIDISAATFLSFNERAYAHAIDPVLYNDVPENKWKYYSETLEPRYDVFDENKISIPALTYNPIDKAIAWIENVWPANIQEVVAKTTLLNLEQFKENNAENWEITNGTMTYDEATNKIVLERIDTSSIATFRYTVPLNVAKNHIAYYTSVSDTEDASDFTITIRDVSNKFDITSRLLEIANSVELQDGFSFSTNQATAIELNIIINSGTTVNISDFELVLSGDDILKMDFPTEWTPLQKEQYCAEFKELFSYEYCLAYYLQALAFMQADNIGKNAMFDVWWDSSTNSWSKIYPRPYDMDSQMGLNNQGQDTVLASSEVNALISPDPTAKTQAQPHRRFVNQYAISFSKLWLLFAYLFNTDIKKTYNSLRMPLKTGEGDNEVIKRPAIYDIETIKQAIEPYTTEAIGECYYNADAQKKFILSNQDNTTNWRMIGGNRYHRYYSFLKDRFDFLDGYFADVANADAAKNKLMFRINTGQTANIQFASKKPSYISHYLEGGASGVVYVDTDIKPSIIWRVQGGNKNGYLYNVQHINNIIGIASLQVEGIDFFNADSLQNLKFSGQKNVGTFDFSQQSALRSLQAENCSKLTKIVLPTNSSNLNRLVYKNLPNMAPEIKLTNSGLVGLELEELGTALTSDKQKFDIALTNTPIQEIKVGTNAKIKKIQLTNCYQLEEFSDPDTRNIKYKDLETLNITQCSKMAKIILPSCKAKTISITNCNNLTELDLSGSTVLTELDLSTLSNLTSVNLTGCTKLTKLILPNPCKITTLLLGNCSKLTTVGYVNELETNHFNFEHFEANENGTWEALTLKNTQPTHVENLNYAGPGKELFYNCTKLTTFTNVQIKFTGADASSCLRGCAALRYNQANITFLPSEEVTNLSEAFWGCKWLGMRIPYQLARACFNASNFSYYIASQKYPASSASQEVREEFELYIALPEEAVENGYFAIFDDNTNTFIARDVSNLNVEGFMYDVWTLRGSYITDNFFKNTPKITSLKSTFAESPIEEINLQAFLQPIFNNLGTNEMLNLQNAFANSDLCNIGDFDENWVDVPVSNLNATFFGTWIPFAPEEDTSIVKLIKGLSNITTANGAFAKTDIQSLRPADGSPLFSNNKKLKYANAMFADCDNLVTLPTHLCSTIDKDFNEAEYALEEISGIFSKEKNSRYPIKVESLDKSFLYNTKIKKLGNYTCNYSNTFGNSKNTSEQYITAGGAFAGIHFNEINSNFADVLKNATDVSGLFAHIDQLRTITFDLTECTKLTTVKGMFQNSSVEEFTKPLFSANNIALKYVDSCFEGSALSKLHNANVWDLPAVTTATAAFKDCQKLRGLINTIEFNTPELTSCASMFENCIGLGCIDLTDPNNKIGVTDSTNFALSRDMFKGAVKLRNTSKMFKNCYSLYGNLPDTTVDNLEGLFAYNSANLQNVSEMFRNCCSLRGNIPQLFTSTERYKYNLLTDISYLFCGCGFLTNPFDNGPTAQATRTLIPQDWLSNCPNILNISGTFAMVGTGYSILSKYATDSQKNDMATADKLAETYYFTQIENDNANIPIEYIEYPFYQVLMQYSGLYSSTETKPILLDLSPLTEVNIAEIRHANETFACLGKISLAGKEQDFANFLKYGNDLDMLAPGLEQANCCFAGTVLTTTLADDPTSLPFYNKGSYNSKLELSGCYANVLDDSKFGKNRYGELSDETIMAYYNTFTSNRGSMFAYDTGIKAASDTTSPYATPSSTTLTSKWSRYAYSDKANTGSYIYACCTKLFDATL